MSKHANNPATGGRNGSIPTKRNPGPARFLAAALLVILALQPACLFRRKKTSEMRYPVSPIRLVLVPLNVPLEKPDLHWVAMASSVLMAKVARSTPDLEAVPFWEWMGVATETMGASKTISPEQAAYIASRSTAQWATQGQLLPAKSGYSLRLDFIPVKPNVVAFRYEKDCSLNELGEHYHRAFSQFLNYIIARPPGINPAQLKDFSSLRDVGRALDLEYGWYSNAAPGKSETVAAAAAGTDIGLARILFNPALYSSLVPR